MNRFLSMAVIFWGLSLPLLGYAYFAPLSINERDSFLTAGAIFAAMGIYCLPSARKRP